MNRTSNRYITVNEIETVVKNLPSTHTLGPDDFYRKDLPNLRNSFT